MKEKKNLPSSLKSLLAWVSVTNSLIYVLINSKGNIYLWTAVWNGHCEQVRIQRIEDAMAAGETSVVLPSYPYPAYVHNGNGGAVRYYYYYDQPCDLEFQYVVHRDWYLN